MSLFHNFLTEFKEFAMRGSVVDLAIGVIIGGAFSKIVTSLVQDLIMPLLGVLLGAINLSGLTVTIGNSTIKYGNFLQSSLDFLLIAFVIFLMMKTLNTLLHQEIKLRKTPAQRQIDLLQEISNKL